jgi:hypothetical protein
MSYFRVDLPCQHYQDQWEALARTVNSSWPPGWQGRVSELTFPLEAKALAIFSFGHRMVRTAQMLAAHANNEQEERWDLVFIEASILLFPMIELIGYARLGTSQSSSSNLIAGIEWLRDPNALPTGNDQTQMRTDSVRLASLGRHMVVHSQEGPTIADVFDTRNYFTHGAKDGGFARIPSQLNFELPLAIVRESRNAMQMYWQALRNDDGNNSWIENLGKARIHPLVIQGSVIFEEGLLEPDILDAWLDI